MPDDGARRGIDLRARRQRSGSAPPLDEPLTAGEVTVSDRKTLVEMLGRNRLFEGFSKKDLTAIVVGATEVEHPKGRVVMEEGKPGVGFHLIVDGTAGVTR